MKIDNAIFDTVHDYGVEEIALRLGQSPHTINHKANPHAHHNFNAGELITIQATTGDYRISHAFAQALGGTFVEPADFSAMGDAALLDQFTGLIAQLGVYAGEFNSALADGRLTPAELSLVRDAAYDITQRLSELDARMATLVESNRRPGKGVK